MSAPVLGLFGAIKYIFKRIGGLIFSRFFSLNGLVHSASLADYEPIRLLKFFYEIIFVGLEMVDWLTHS